VTDRAAVDDWVARYEAAWRRPGTDTLSELFTDDATYSTAPYEPLYRGLAQIAALWDVERESPDEVFTMTYEIVAVEGTTAVVRVLVRYGDPLRQEYRDLWIVSLDADGRCRAFEEWPFWPEGTNGQFASGPA
jgi:ketosteroid isomerase-like protein